MLLLAREEAQSSLAASLHNRCSLPIGLIWQERLRWQIRPVRKGVRAPHCIQPFLLHPSNHTSNHYSQNPPVRQKQTALAFQNSTLDMHPCSQSCRASRSNGPAVLFLSSRATQPILFFLFLLFIDSAYPYLGGSPLLRGSVHTCRRGACSHCVFALVCHMRCRLFRSVESRRGRSGPHSLPRLDVASRHHHFIYSTAVAANPVWACSFLSLFTDLFFSFLDHPSRPLFTRSSLAQPRSIKKRRVEQLFNTNRSLILISSYLLSAPTIT